MKINKWKIYYLPRKIIEPNSNGKEEEKRPVLVLKKYNDNVMFFPITKNNNDSSHIRISSFSKEFSFTYVKISVIQTISIKKFVKMGNSRNYKINNDDILKLETNIKEFLNI